ncbi:MAG: carboxymuconolactone decarboxylase family protein [Chitinophagaceae bacterium]|nr:carboxymuconolactone decarboxylase family protein [Chitinophagaceae bacterium]
MKQTITKEQVYDIATENFGLIPGIIRELAERSAATAYLFTYGTAIMESASFSHIEMNAIELKISALNHCESCIKGHSFLLQRAGMTESDITAIKTGSPTGNERINMLLQATEYIFFAGGGEYPGHVIQYLQENLSEKELVDIIGLIAVKTIANYTNNYLATVKKYSVHQ